MKKCPILRPILKIKYCGDITARPRPRPPTQAYKRERYQNFKKFGLGISTSIKVHLKQKCPTQTR